MDAIQPPSFMMYRKTARRARTRGAWAVESPTMAMRQKRWSATGHQNRTAVPASGPLSTVQTRDEIAGQRRSNQSINRASYAGQGSPLGGWLTTGSRADRRSADICTGGFDELRPEKDKGKLSISGSESGTRTLAALASARMAPPNRSGRCNSKPASSAVYCDSRGMIARVCALPPRE